MTNILRLQTVWSGIEGAPYYSTMYATSDGLAAGAEASQSAVKTFWDSLLPRIRSGLRYDMDAQVEEIDDATGNLTGAYPVTPRTGFATNIAEILPIQTCGLVQWTTGVIVGRRLLRGRTFIPLPTESENDTLGVPTTAYSGALRVAAAALISSASIELLVWSRTHGVSHVVTNGTVWSKWAGLRTHRD